MRLYSPGSKEKSSNSKNIKRGTQMNLKINTTDSDMQSGEKVKSKYSSIDDGTLSLNVISPDIKCRRPFYNVFSKD